MKCLAFTLSAVLTILTGLGLEAMAGNAAVAETEIIVFAAASTTSAVTEIGRIYESRQLGRITLSFASSSTLAKQIENGAPADVYISADKRWMDYLEEKRLLTSPALLLMDEPLAALDAARKAELLPFIMRLSREFAIPILYVSHSMDEILNLATRIVLMHEGRVTASGELEDLLSRSDLQPHFGGSESGSVLSTVVETPEDAFGLTHLRFGDKILKVGGITAVKGESVRVRIPARHVAIALEPPARTSFQNIFPGEIREIVACGTPFVDIHLDIGRSLWARITRQTFLDLNLKTGRIVFALVKSVAVSLGTAMDEGRSLR